MLKSQPRSNAIRFGRALLLILVLSSSVDARSRPAGPAPAVKPADIFSAANDTQVRTEHLSLDLTVDFEARRISGSATHDIINLTGATELILDTRDLDIDSVLVDGDAAEWRLGDSSNNGRPLVIEIGSGSKRVRVNYRTRPSSTALFWLTASQTLGRVMPALYTQGQPDHARSWIPVQDSPGVRMTWEATVRVPDGMLALMSAPNPTDLDPDNTYRFEMSQTVPAYLIVISVGRFAFRSLGPRIGIYAEPELLDDAVYEMQFLPDMFAVAEELLGPYPWERYDLLFPPQFGGGMENTTLNFISPDHISRNQPVPVLPTGLIAHELAHSWLGDMLTCATWSDTWLNEGSATYYEKRILEVMQGVDRAELGYYYDRQAIEGFLKSNPQYPRRLSTMHRTFMGQERPGNTFNLFAYQKGELFLKMLEDELGRQEFDAFMGRYIEKNRFHWVDDKAFLGELAISLRGMSPDEVEALNLEEWIYEGGLPPNVTAPTSSAILNRLQIQADAFNRGMYISQLDRTGWTSLDNTLFLQLIAITPARMAELDEGFRLSELHSPPILWLIAVAKTRDARWLPQLEAYLLRGTSASLAIWQELAETSSGKQYALALYPRAREFYSDNSRRFIELTLGLRTSKDSLSPAIPPNPFVLTDSFAKSRVH